MFLRFLGLYWSSECGMKAPKEVTAGTGQLMEDMQKTVPAKDAKEWIKQATKIGEVAFGPPLNSFSLRAHIHFLLCSDFRLPFFLSVCRSNVLLRYCTDDLALSLAFANIQKHWQMTAQ